MTSLSQLRQQRHRVWLAELKQQLHELLGVEHMLHPEQIYLFGSRARGDWDELSDIDLLVVGTSKSDTERWVNLPVGTRPGPRPDRIGSRKLDGTAGPSFGHMARRGP